MHLLARLALILGLIAFALTLPVLPFTFDVLMGDEQYPASSDWTGYPWLAAPFIGIVSLVVGARARRRIEQPPVQLADLHVVAVAKRIAWLAAIPWSLTMVGAAAVSL